MVLSIFKYHGFDMALDMVRQIFETGGKGHSCGIYSFDDDHIHRLALVAPVSRIMVRQVQSSSNAGTFTNGMPMTSSMGCGIWGGNITNENISLKHYMNVTWVSRPIAGGPAVRAGAVRRVLQLGNLLSPRRGTTMSTAIHVIPEPLPTTTETRFAAYLLADYLERLGVEVVFGLTGHTVIGMLDALGRSRIRYVSTRHEQVAAHAADGYARASGKPGVLLTHLGPGLTNAATGVANAALDSIPMVVIAGDVQSYFHGRHPHQEINLHQDADQYQIYRPFCKRVYRVDHARDLPRIMERAFHLAQTGRPGPVLVDVPMDVFSASLPIDAFNKVPAEIAPPVDRRRDRGTDRGGAGRAPSGRCSTPAAACCRRARRRSSQALAEALELPIAHTPDGQGRGARGSSAAARHDRLLGHADRQREVPDRRCDPRRRHAPRGSELELVGSALHLRHPADAADPHRRRRRRDRPQLPHRARRRRRREARARRAGQAAPQV